MSSRHLVLARKYRPQTLSDVIGQDILVQTIRNAFIDNKLPQAILLTGTRGIGKTTVARIIAKYLNCTHIKTNGPNNLECCNECDSCISISNSSHPDVLELDAASNTGVADVREIIDSVKYSPIKAQNKVYIIDEVHMLSNSAFNALLKTLEEPPQNIYFILATTEEQKVLRTIVSRCHHFRLRPITHQLIEERCDRILKNECYNPEQGVSELIARVANGSMRDALSMLDSAVLFCADENKHLSLDKAMEMLGYQNHAAICEIFQYVCQGDAEKCLEKLSNIHASGVEASTVCSNLLLLIHEITKTSSISTDRIQSEIVSSWSNNAGDLRDIVEKIEMPFLLRSWDILTNTLSQIKEYEDSIMYLEMALIKLMYLNTISSPESILEKIDIDNIKQKASQNASAKHYEGCGNNIMQMLLEKSLEEVISSFQQLTSIKKLNSQYQGFSEKTLQIFNRLRVLLAFLLDKNEVVLYYRLSNLVKIIDINIEKKHMILGTNDHDTIQMIDQIRNDISKVTESSWTIEVVKDINGYMTYIEFLNMLDKQHEEVLLKTDLVTSIMSEFDCLKPERIIKNTQIH